MKAIELTGMKGMKGIGSNSFESGKGGLSQRRRERRGRIKSGVNAVPFKSGFFEHEVHEVTQS